MAALPSIQDAKVGLMTNTIVDQLGVRQGALKKKVWLAKPLYQIFQQKSRTDWYKLVECRVKGHSLEMSAGVLQSYFSVAVRNTLFVRGRVALLVSCPSIAVNTSR